MKVGVFLYPIGGRPTADGQLEQAKAADRQGFDSVWLGDHLMEFAGEPGPDAPLDSFTLMTAIGAVTERVRLGWGMLNPSFRNPALLAKMLATLDQISHGRVICSIGAGWFEDEYTAYDLPFIADHEERIAHEREVVQLMQLLWTTPAPERVGFEGRYVRARELPFAPAPYQEPHPPIWIGGDSDGTLGLVEELAEGWVLSRSGLDRIEEGLAAIDPALRPTTVAKIGYIAVGETDDDARVEALKLHAALGEDVSFEDFCEHQVVGTPETCRRLLAEREERGWNYLLTRFRDEAHQEKFARLLLPLLEHALA